MVRIYCSFLQQMLTWHPVKPHSHIVGAECGPFGLHVGTFTGLRFLSTSQRQEKEEVNFTQSHVTK